MLKGRARHTGRAGGHSPQLPVLLPGKPGPERGRRRWPKVAGLCPRSRGSAQGRGALPKGAQIRPLSPSPVLPAAWHPPHPL